MTSDICPSIESLFIQNQRDRKINPYGSSRSWNVVVWHARMNLIGSS